MGKAKKLKKLTEGLKLIGDKVVKKRMTTKERNEMSKPFKKMLSDAQKSKKGMSKKEFDARVKKGMAKDARIAKVKAENMAAATGPIKPKKKAAGGMMSPQPMPTMRRRPPISMPPRPPKTPVRKAPAKRPPGGGRPNPPAASKAVPNLDPAMLAKVRSKLQQESIRRGSSNSSKPVAKKTSGSSSAGGSQKDQPSEVSKVKKKFKGPGMKDGGSVKAYKAGGTVSKSKATGAAKRGFGKAYMKGKR